MKLQNLEHINSKFTKFAEVLKTFINFNNGY